MRSKIKFFQKKAQALGLTTCRLCDSHDVYLRFRDGEFYAVSCENCKAYTTLDELFWMNRAGLRLFD